jgi:uncharacterized protein YlxP (DUF503 family)
MMVGVARVVLLMPENASLKDKRQVVKSLLARLRQTFQLSAAEVDTQDSWRTATLGLAFVANDARFAEQVLSKALSFIETTRLDAEVGSCETEFIHVF